MMWNRSALVVAIGMILSLNTTNIFAEGTPGPAEEHGAGGAGGRPAEVERATPPTYNKLIEKLKSAGDVRKVKAIGSDPTEVENSRPLEKDVEIGGASRTRLVGADGNSGLLGTIKSYRDKVARCDIEKDPSSKFMYKALDSYIAFLDATFENFDTARIQEKFINTHTLQLLKFLDHKKAAFGAQEASFKKSDGELKTALENLAGALWGNADDKFRRDKFTEEMARASDDQALKKIVTDMDTWIPRMESQATSTDKKACIIDEQTGPAPQPSGNPTPSGTPVRPSNVPVPPPGTPVPQPSGSPTPPGGTPPGGTPPGGTPPGGTPPAGQVPTADQLAAERAQIAAAQAALDAARQGIEEQRRINDQQAALAAQELARAQEQDANANKALQDALANAQRPNNNRSNEKSEQGPQISPSTDLGGGKGQQTPPQPPPPLAPEPPPQNPFLPLLGQQSNSGMSPELLAMMMKDNKNYEPEPRRRAAPVQSEGSAYLAEMVKILQQQMSMMQQRMQPYVNGAYNGVMNVGNRLAGWATRGARGGSVARYNGTAKAGAQGSMSVAGARGPLPQRLSR